MIYVMIRFPTFAREFIQTLESYLFVSYFQVHELIKINTLLNLERKKSHVRHK